MLIKSKEHLMNVRYANLEGTNIEIGRKLAEMIIKNHPNSNEVTKMDDLSIYKQRLEYFKMAVLRNIAYYQEALYLNFRKI